MSAPILPGSTIGILGGGQLGRMMALSARSLGYRIACLDPDPHCGAHYVVEEHVVARFDDVLAAEWLASKSQVVTLEIEKIGLDALEAVERRAPLRPGAHVLGIVQDRAKQRAWLASQGFPQGAHGSAAGADELRTLLVKLGGKAFVKAARGGYDGRGQYETKTPEDANKAWEYLGAEVVVAEEALTLELELSVMVARNVDGHTAVFPASYNHHIDRILAWSVLPGAIDERISAKAQEIAVSIANAIGCVGLLATEFFVTSDGRILVNELAPRPHNSFHATEAACATSQFEQAVRAVCNLPLGSTEVVRPTAMANLLGDLWVDHKGVPPFERLLSLPGVRLFLYGKDDARRGRKMGHILASAADPNDARRLVEEAVRRLEP
jgi:5-(carboxyamino)imidazole ribonucleotide synthase